MFVSNILLKKAEFAYKKSPLLQTFKLRFFISWMNLF